MSTLTMLAVSNAPSPYTALSPDASRAPPPTPRRRRRRPPPPPPSASSASGSTVGCATRFHRPPRCGPTACATPTIRRASGVRLRLHVHGPGGRGAHDGDGGEGGVQQRAASGGRARRLRRALEDSMPRSSGAVTVRAVRRTLDAVSANSENPVKPVTAGFPGPHKRSSMPPIGSVTVANKNIPDSGFSDDDGSADPRLSAALAAWAEDRTAERPGPRGPQGRPAARPRRRRARRGRGGRERAAPREDQRHGRAHPEGRRPHRPARLHLHRRRSPAGTPRPAPSPYPCTRRCRPPRTRRPTRSCSTWPGRCRTS